MSFKMSIYARSGRLGQVNVVRGCAGLPGNSDLTPTAERRHRTGAPRRHLLIGNIGSGGRQRQAPGRGTGTIQSSSAPIRQSQFTRAVRRITALSQSRQHERLTEIITGNTEKSPCRSGRQLIEFFRDFGERDPLRVRTELDKREYPTGVTATDAEMEALSLHRNEFHADWNYEVHLQ